MSIGLCLSTSLGCAISAPMTGAMGGGQRAETFGIRTGAALSTPTTSRKCYFTASEVAFTVPADTEISFDGSTWLSSNGTTPAGAKFWYCRFTSSADYLDPLTKTPTLGGVNYPFSVITTADPIQAILAQDGEGILLQDGEQLIY